MTAAWNHIALNVADLPRAERFYTAILGFTLDSRAPFALAPLFGARSGRETRLRRGAQILALRTFDPPGAPYPSDPTACDQSFQHFAMPVPDIAQAAASLPSGLPRITTGGPQRLPARSGGVTALKFRDPDGHPLEFIQFPRSPGTRRGGIDHSAIVAADPGRSIAFYAQLGLRLAARQTNTGLEQDRLDGLAGVTVDVIALALADPAPHLELLAYRTPAIRPATTHPTDVAATCLGFELDGLAGPALRTDPDGHHLLLLPAP